MKTKIVISKRPTTKFVKGKVYADLAQRFTVGGKCISYLQFVKRLKSNMLGFLLHSGEDQYYHLDNNVIPFKNNNKRFYLTNLKPLPEKKSKAKAIKPATAKKSKVYHNTTKLEGEQLKQATHKAILQDRRVLSIFKRRKRPMTPAEVWQIYCKLHPACPITSIRRSMTNLTYAGTLVKTDIKVKGLYNMPNYKWRLA